MTDDQLIECFESFIRMGNYFSPCNPDAPFIIEELEINPFTFTDYLMSRWTACAAFRLPANAPLPVPSKKSPTCCTPKSIGIIGVSSKRRNFGRIILENIIDSGFDRDKLVIIRDGEN